MKINCIGCLKCFIEILLFLFEDNILFNGNKIYMCWKDIVIFGLERF